MTDGWSTATATTTVLNNNNRWIRTRLACAVCECVAVRTPDQFNCVLLLWTCRYGRSFELFFTLTQFGHVRLGACICNMSIKCRRFVSCVCVWPYSRARGDGGRRRRRRCCRRAEMNAINNRLVSNERETIEAHARSQQTRNVIMRNRYYNVCVCVCVCSCTIYCIYLVIIEFPNRLLSGVHVRYFAYPSARDN